MTCAHCGGDYSTKGNQFCSKRCAVRARPKRDPGERFWAKVQKTDACWLWTGGTNEWGYGSFYWRERSGAKGGMRAAHRAAYELAVGRIPPGMHVLHRCDNPPCCRPDHLFLGTNADNSTDKVDKRRHPYGVTSPNHKLTDDAIRAIRAEASAGVTHRVLAKRFNVSQPAISNIANRKRWAHVV